MQNDIESKLKEIIFTYSKAELKPEEIHNQTDLITDLGFDSISIIQLIVEIEDSFNIVFSDNDMDIEKLGSYGQLLQLIVKSRQ